jgi:hypothetical protein
MDMPLNRLRVNQAETCPVDERRVVRNGVILDSFRPVHPAFSMCAAALSARARASAERASCAKPEEVRFYREQEGVNEIAETQE